VDVVGYGLCVSEGFFTPSSEPDAEASLALASLPPVPGHQLSDVPIPPVLHPEIPIEAIIAQANQCPARVPDS
jgi:hypothetical protein